MNYNKELRKKTWKELQVRMVIIDLQNDGVITNAQMGLRDIS